MFEHTPGNRPPLADRTAGEGDREIVLGDPAMRAVEQVERKAEQSPGSANEPVWQDTNDRDDPLNDPVLKGVSHRIGGEIRASNLARSHLEKTASGSMVMLKGTEAAGTPKLIAVSRAASFSVI